MAKRLKKTTRSQYEDLIKFVERNRILLRGKMKQNFAHKVDGLWQQFAALENPKGNGPPKNAFQWRKIFNEWKVNTKRKSKAIQLKLNGSEFSCNKQLTDLEEKLLILISNLDARPNRSKCSGDALANLAGIQQKANGVEDIEHMEELAIDGIKVESLPTDEDYTCASISDDPFSGEVIELKHVEDVPIVETASEHSRLEIPAEPEMIPLEILQTVQTICSEPTDTSQKTHLPFVETKATAIRDMANAIKKLSDVCEQGLALKRAKLKLEYYKVFGKCEGFDEFCK
ncbi:hypothetical protein PPYR_13306 [Photinus pyralis]|uniref:Regulatory protein zeste n=1 Tax=Photinus pyralis TaxID=7054 RepID=A0A1Y1K5J7_PHOPY|nr:uncharacterized protein LOC116179590 isoform X1 [Photinus pyralis]KAB0793686.1 hypothetical protein PPYR_13306 [Photinus pyralis]